MWTMTEGCAKTVGAGASGPAGERKAGQERRDVTGILVLDKPTGMTSNAALQAVRRLYRARKAGHTGSLDPLASGVLPICLGEATKISGLILGARKSYDVVARLGERTDTGDAEGRIIERRDSSGITLSAVRGRLPEFMGDIEQVPPMYSALKHRGRRLYELARRGQTVERRPRPVVIYALQAISLNRQELELRVCCSKGTYVRTLVEDIATALGTVAHVVSLRRTAAGSLDHSRQVSLEDLERAAGQGLRVLDALLMAPDRALPHVPAVRLDSEQARRIQLGQRVAAACSESGVVRVYGPEETFLGLGEAGEGGRVAPRRMFRTDGPHGARTTCGEEASEAVADRSGKVQ